MSSKPPGTISIPFSTSNNSGRAPASGDAAAASCPSSALHLPRAGLAKSQGGDEDIADARPGRGRAAAPALCAGSGVTQAAGSGVLQRGRKRAPRWEGCAPGLVRAGTGQSRAGTPAGTQTCSRQLGPPPMAGNQLGAFIVPVADGKMPSVGLLGLPSIPIPGAFGVGVAQHPHPGTLQCCPPSPVVVEEENWENWDKQRWGFWGKGVL